MPFKFDEVLHLMERCKLATNDMKELSEID